MTHTRILRMSVLAAVLLAAGCASRRDETWIGKNVGVTVDSFAQQGQATSR